MLGDAVRAHGLPGALQACLYVMFASLRLPAMGNAWAVQAGFKQVYNVGAFMLMYGYVARCNKQATTMQPPGHAKSHQPAVPSSTAHDKNSCKLL